MRGFWGVTREERAGVRDALQASARTFVAEQRALLALWQAAPEDQREFVAGEVACLLHVSPRTGADRLAVALDVLSVPPLVAALEQGRLGVPHALALLDDTSHLEAPLRHRVLSELLAAAELDDDGLDVRTPGELRAAAKRLAISIDAEAARRRREQAERDRTGVRGRPDVDGMARLTVDATVVQVALAEKAIKARAAAMTFDEELTQGQREVAALLHALGCERVQVQAVLECPVERAVDLHAAAHAPVWTLDVRMPVAVALGLSDHPGLLSGYGPIDADQARALLPCAELVKACVDTETGEVLAVGSPRRPGRPERPERSGRPGLPGLPGRPERAGRPVGAEQEGAGDLRQALLAMVTTAETLQDLSVDGYVPSAALGRLVDLRDVTSVFPGDATSARRSQRDHRLPYPLGRTDEENLQNLGQRWHRAKHAGWRTRLLADGTVRWTSPGGGVYDRAPKRTRPPRVGRVAEQRPPGEPPSG